MITGDRICLLVSTKYFATRVFFCEVDQGCNSKGKPVYLSSTWQLISRSVINWCQWNRCSEKWSHAHHTHPTPNPTYKMISICIDIGDGGRRLAIVFRKSLPQFMNFINFIILCERVVAGLDKGLIFCLPGDMLLREVMRVNISNDTMCDNSLFYPYSSDLLPVTSK